MVGCGSYVEQRLNTRGVLSGLVTGQQCAASFFEYANHTILEVGSGSGGVCYREAVLLRGMMQRPDLARKVHLGPSSFPPPKVTFTAALHGQAFTTLTSSILLTACLEHHR